MVKGGLGEQRPSPEFRKEILKRIGHWERFKGSDEEKLDMVASDPEWVRLMETEIELEPMSPECRAIRKQISCMEACHEHYVGNVEAILGMIGAMTPGRVLDCGQASAERREEAEAYAQALEAWREADAPSDERARDVFDLLGERTHAKRALVEHLIGKLRDNAYRVYADQDEDFELTESRIQHLAICNYNWRENLRIVLQEIGAGKRLFEWHTPDGYNAHGDVPDRIPQLRDPLAGIVAWLDGRADEAGRWGEALGEATPEKRWLAASLCKHVRVQHEKVAADRLPRPEGWE